MGIRYKIRKIFLKKNMITILLFESKMAKKSKMIQMRLKSNYEVTLISLEISNYEEISCSSKMVRKKLQTPKKYSIIKKLMSCT